MASQHNTEGYHDPTVFGVFTNIEAEERKARFRPVVYVCSPYSGDVGNNTAAARRYCRFVVDHGGVPVAPHLLFPQFMDDGKPEERELALFMDIVLLTRCAEIWVFGSDITAGMRREIVRADQRGMRIRRFTADCKEVQ